MKNDCYYMHLERINPFYSYYAYFDVPEFFADQLFIQHQVRVRFSGEYQKKGKQYVIVLCRVRKKDEERFLEALGELPRKVLLLGYPNYLKDCSELIEHIEKQRQSTRSVS